MDYFIILIIVILLSVLFFVIYNKRNEDILVSLKKYSPDLKKAILEFEEFGNEEQYFSNRQYILWKEKYSFLYENIVSRLAIIKTKDSFKKNVLHFRNYYTNGRKIYINEYNNKFVIKESLAIKNLLNKLGIPNNAEQLNAIASGEDNTLVVAGAGAGKTTTILGKLSYLLKGRLVNPKEILLLSFTGKAVEELATRIENIFGDIDINVKTFHSFGRSIITSAEGEKIGVVSSNFSRDFINEQFNSLLADKEYRKKAIKYFAYYFKPIITEKGFNNLNEYEIYLETEENLTLKKEKVKSRQEAMIANFLYLNNIRYTYEKPYKFNTADLNHGQYKPDFYLEDYDIYIEHFGIDRLGMTGFSKDNSRNIIISKKYLKDIDWKKKLHTQYNTKLIDTYSYNFSENQWEEVLTRKLKEQGVKFYPQNPDEVLVALSKTKVIKKIIDLFDIFLKLSKSNGYSIKDLFDKVDEMGGIREKVFFTLFKPLYLSYAEELNKQNKIDFDDMLIRATQIINQYDVKKKFQYIIIDEFQDVSVSKSNLIKSLINQNPDAKLFCVGDDWQSIFRFTGSDISLMTNFEDNFGFTKNEQLVYTNRFSQQMALLSNSFILKNPNQISKKLASARNADDDILEIVTYDKDNDDNQAINGILKNINNSASSKKNKVTVHILGRYNKDKPKDMHNFIKNYKRLNIEFLTIHTSKGTEADYVIINKVINDIYGFPCGIADDSILNLVLNKKENFLYAEERRLMYVAITRARMKVFITTKKGEESPFILELRDIQNQIDTSVKKRSNN